MADLSMQHHPTPGFITDPGRQTITMHVYPVTLVLRADEARQLRDELVKALGQLAVKGADEAVAEAGVAT